MMNSWSNDVRKKILAWVGVIVAPLLAATLRNEAFCEVEEKKQSKSQVFIDVPWVVLFAFFTIFGYNLSETVYIITSTSTTSIHRNKPSRWLLGWLNPQ